MNHAVKVRAYEVLLDGDVFVWYGDMESAVGEADRLRENVVSGRFVCVRLAERLVHPDVATREGLIVA